MYLSTYVLLEALRVEKYQYQLCLRPREMLSMNTNITKDLKALRLKTGSASALATLASLVPL